MCSHLQSADTRAEYKNPPIKERRTRANKNIPTGILLLNRSAEKYYYKTPGYAPGTGIPIISKGLKIVRRISRGIEDENEASANKLMLATAT